MKLLLDANALIWSLQHPERLPRPAQKAISDAYNTRFISIATLWEMQIKHSLGKLNLPGDIEKIAPVWLDDLRAECLPIKLGHLSSLHSLPKIHRDPFDRLLIAQALNEGMAIVTSDSTFREYGVELVW